jgi:hypothetical protein
LNEWDSQALEKIGELNARGEALIRSFNAQRVSGSDPETLFNPSLIQRP